VGGNHASEAAGEKEKAISVRAHNSGKDTFRLRTQEL